MEMESARSRVNANGKVCCKCKQQSLAQMKTARFDANVNCKV